MKFVTEQPRLSLICQSLFHLASLQPVHKNSWEKPLAHTLATTLYEDLKRLGGLLNNVPLNLALEHLKRKGFASLLRMNPAPIVDPIDRFYRLLFQLEVADKQAIALMDDARTQFGSRVQQPRTTRIIPEHRRTNSSTATPRAVSAPAAPSTAAAVDDIRQSSLSVDSQSEFGDIEFEDVLEDMDEPLDVEVSAVKKPEEAVEEEKKDVPHASAATAAESMTRAESYRKSRRDIEMAIEKLKVVQKKLLAVEDRRNWLPRQNQQYASALARIEELLQILSQCSDLYAEAVLALSSEHHQDGTVVVELSTRR